MKSLENTLKILETSATDFDIEVFVEDFMSIPYQIKKIDKNIKTLNEKEVKRYFSVLSALKEEALKANPTDELQKNTIKDILFAIDEELHKEVA